ncbi:40229_t:CDS:2 [Gigaspora margarita]|uniref:40229_t:CDS:1 n=1 Tax=Gigaspora margarita TaxID=4874 RepID=A0ABN7VJE8_GIGMA|nr:40229_t:CDS:2 [Gigaspora margarita]
MGFVKNQVLQGASETFSNPNLRPISERISLDLKTILKKKEQELAIVQAIDKYQIPQNAYYILAVIQPELPCCYTISDQCIALILKIENSIPIYMFNIANNILLNEEEFATVNTGILHPLQPIINLRISGNGHNVGKKIKHKIEKDINVMASNHFAYSGYIRAPLILMISLSHWVPNKPHIILKITDRLESLIISELEQNREFDDNMYKTICQEIKQQKWKEYFLQPDIANINNPNNIVEEKLYQLSDIIPYIHVFVYYILEFMEIYQEFELDGGNPNQKTCTIKEIMNYKNHQLYYTYNNNNSFDKLTRI